MTPRGPARRIRIVHLLDSLDPAGVERSVLELVRRLDPARFESRVWYMSGPGPMRRHFKAAGIPVSRILRIGYRDLSCVPRLTLSLRMARADILHTHHPAATAFGRLAAPHAALGGVVTTEHQVHHWVDPGSFVNRLVRSTRPVADRVVAVSKTVEYLTLGAGAAGPDQVRIIADGHSPADPPSRVRGTVPSGLPPSAPVVASLGRIEPHKGFRSFLEMAALVRTERPDASFVIAGEGQERPALEERARELGIAGSVRFAGALTEPEALLRTASVVVIPSTTEAGGLAALEAMAHRVPVVGTRVGGLAELMEDGAGLLVNPNAPRELAAVVLYLLSSPLYAAEVGGSGLKKVEGTGSAERMAAEYAALYEEVLAGSEG